MDSSGSYWQTVPMSAPSRRATSSATTEKVSVAAACRATRVATRCNAACSSSRRRSSRWAPVCSFSTWATVSPELPFAGGEGGGVGRREPRVVRNGRMMKASPASTRFGDCPTPGREDHLAAAGRDGDAIRPDESGVMVGDDATTEGRERDALTIRFDPGQVAESELGVVLVQAGTKIGLDRTRGCQRDRVAVWMGGPHSAGEVDDPEHLPVVRVVDGRGGARPAVHHLTQVLGRMDLYRMVGRDRRTDRVRARAPFAPQRALDEVHRVGSCRAQLRVALHPQQEAVGIADHDEMFTLVGNRAQPFTDQRRRRLERMSFPTLGDLAAIAHQRRGSARDGVQAGRARPLPRLGDRQPYRIEPAVGEEPVPDRPQHTRSRLRRGRDVNREPRVVRHWCRLRSPGRLGRVESDHDQIRAVKPCGAWKNSSRHAS